MLASALAMEETTMLIAHVLSDKGALVHTLTADATLEVAAKALDQRKIGAIVVMGDDGGVVGVLSERDIVRALSRGGVDAFSATIATVMTRDVIFASVDESIDLCLARMTDRRIRHLPVVDNGALIGIVSIGDLVKYRIAAVEAEAAAMQAYITAH